MVRNVNKLGSLGLMGPAKDGIHTKRQILAFLPPGKSVKEKSVDRKICEREESEIFPERGF